MQTTIQNQAGFKKLLTNWTTGQVKQRDQLQDCLLYGLKQYKDHGNLTPLSEVVCSIDKVRTIKTDYIKEYIKAHANVRLTKGEDKALPWVFKKHGKDIDVKEPTLAWYDHSSNKTKVTEDVDGLALLRAALVKALKADTAGKLKAGQSATIKKASELLKDMLNPSAESKPALAVVKPV